MRETASQEVRRLPHNSMSAHNQIYYYYYYICLDSRTINTRGIVDITRIKGTRHLVNTYTPRRGLSKNYGPALSKRTRLFVQAYSLVSTTVSSSSSPPPAPPPQHRPVSTQTLYTNHPTPTDHSHPHPSPSPARPRNQTSRTSVSQPAP